MNVWDPFHPLAYFLHTVLGVGGLLGAIVALSLAKGSRFHIFAGRVFVTAAVVAAATAIGFSLSSFAPMAIASAVMLLSVVGSAVLAQRSKSTWVAAGEFVTTILMAFVLLWLIYGVVISVPQGGHLWIPPLILALLAAAFMVNDIRFTRLPAAERKSKQLPRHFSRMGFAFAIAVHEPIVIFSDDLRIPASLAFYGPLIIWPVIVLYFNARFKGRSVAATND